MKKRLINTCFPLILLCLFATIGNAQEEKLQIRLGVTGTGTYDEGLWYFKDNLGIGPQVFEFKNSWGFAFDLDYYLSSRLSAGIHLNYASTGFELRVQEGVNVGITSDPTSHHQLIGEIKYAFRPNYKFRPFLGLNAGVLITKNIELTLLAQEVNFEFINPFIYGLVLGFDHSIGKNGWSLNVIIRGQSFEYTTEETNLTYRQTLLDQVWWMNYNHIQVGVGKRF